MVGSGCKGRGGEAQEEGGGAGGGAWEEEEEGGARSPTFFDSYSLALLIQLLLPLLSFNLSGIQLQACKWQ